MKHAATAALLVLAGATPGLAQSCDEFWYQRNMIYKEAGYCFKTAKAIRSFGNAGCRYDDQADVPLSARQRAEIAEITSMERSMRCAP
ncbi:YARHG domain-containing protein [Methylobacterium currus]|uniref:YARHG domain-containing protein n=1 Tax=Methylobacterium currus TaxID=2051553 RepID=A0A2R4WFW0_9HYPH|nr:YARHG domain-containing protein [Methylobacterium currus]AWB20432.1 YARHG domain-containing protein [Methylobacterium currus]UHC14810.1 YARHG domain-containing protein [Methylobacterium currus]